MPLPTMRWSIYPAAPFEFVRRIARAGHHDVVAQILYNRQVVSPEDAARFIDAGSKATFHSPFLLPGMREAVDRVVGAIRRDERVVIYGDFDADGVTSTALLVQTLSAFGCNAGHYIPNRVDEGYGLNEQALDRLNAEGTDLVITVDCGIRSFAEAARARAIGLDLIITDHHPLQYGDFGEERLPDALAVVSPWRRGDATRYPFDRLAGVGVAFKLAQALLEVQRHEPFAVRDVQLQEEQLLDLVAIGTVADLAPLLDENRYLVSRGLVAVRAARRPGVRAMLEEAGVAPARADAQTIGFTLGPRINAAGRLENAETAYQLLMAPDMTEAQDLARALGDLNRRRQTITVESVERAKALLPLQDTGGYVAFVADEEFLEGIIGLVAGRLADELCRPSFVVRRGAETSRGSARSIAGFDITGALDECRHLLVRHGGHHQAAGFTVRTELLPELHARLERIAAERLGSASPDGPDLRPMLEIDAEVALSDLDFAVIGQVERLAPFGEGNPRPVFLSRGLEVVEQRTVGADGRHLKLKVREGGGRPWSAIAFRFGEWYGKLPPRVDLAYAPEINEYNGRSELQLNVKDFGETGATPA